MDSLLIGSIAASVLSIGLGSAALLLTLRGVPRRLLKDQEDLAAEQSKLKRQFGDLAAECAALDTAVERRLEEMEGLRTSIEQKRRRTRASEQAIEQKQNGELEEDGPEAWLRRARASGFPNA